MKFAKHDVIFLLENIDSIDNIAFNISAFVILEFNSHLFFYEEL